MAREFLREFWTQHREPGSSPPLLKPATLDRLVRAPWPGNVRELRNVIEHLVVVATPGDEIEPEDLTFVDGQSRNEGDHGPVFDTRILDQDYHTARERVLAQFEVDYLTRVVQSAGGNISVAARMAGVDRTTLYRLMEKHDKRRDRLLRPYVSDGIA